MSGTAGATTSCCLSRTIAASSATSTGHEACRRRAAATMRYSSSLAQARHRAFGVTASGSLGNRCLPQVVDEATIRLQNDALCGVK